MHYSMYLSLKIILLVKLTYLSLNAALNVVVQGCVCLIFKKTVFGLLTFFMVNNIYAKDNF